jgi:hypothetical protein
MFQQVTALPCGHQKCSNLSPLVFCFLFLLLPLGVAEAPLPFWKWKGNCVKCGKLRKGTNGLFCGNFGYKRGGCFEICRCVWCGACYTPHHLDNFHVNVPADESGFEWLSKEKDALRFLQGRDGDHLMTPFQCDWCIFRMLTHRIPSSTNRQDEYLLCLVRRANLDAL